MGLTQYLTQQRPVTMQRVSAPPAATRFDAVFVDAVVALAASLRAQQTAPASPVD